MAGGIFSRLLGKKPELQLIVEGAVTECGEHQPRTHLGPTEAAKQAYFALDVSAAQLSNGKSRPTASIVPAEFSGDVALLGLFGVGDRVRITCSTATGREIAEIVGL